MLDDITESGLKILSVLTNKQMVSQIAILTGLSNTTIRRLLQRLEVFGLVEDFLVDQSKHFALTKEGRTLVKRLNKKSKETEKAEQPIAQESVATKEPAIVATKEPAVEVEPKEPEREQFDLSAYLLQKAQALRVLSDELTAMAYNLSAYEE